MLRVARRKFLKGEGFFINGLIAEAKKESDYIITAARKRELFDMQLRDEAGGVVAGVCDMHGNRIFYAVPMQNGPDIHVPVDVMTVSQLEMVARKFGKFKVTFGRVELTLSAGLKQLQKAIESGQLPANGTLRDLNGPTVWYTVDGEAV